MNGKRGTSKKCKKNPSLLNQEFEYIPASKTDIRKTFQRFGWIGPEAQRNQGVNQ